MNRTIKIVLIVAMAVVVSLLLGLVAAAIYVPLRSSRLAPAEQETASIPDVGLTFEIPAGWQRQGGAWVWTSGQQRLGVAWSDVIPGQEPEPLFLPQGSVVLDRTPGPELSWGTAATYRLQVMAPDGEGQVQAFEAHVIIRATGRLYDIYAGAPDEEQLAALEPVLLGLLASATPSQ